MFLHQRCQNTEKFVVDKLLVFYMESATKAKSQQAGLACNYIFPL